LKAGRFRLADNAGRHASRRLERRLYRPRSRDQSLIGRVRRVRVWADELCTSPDQ